MRNNIPQRVVDVSAYRPLLDLLENIFITPRELAQRWRFSEDYLSNVRRAGKGPPWIRLPARSIRYRVADIVEAELAGAGGPISVDEVCLAVSVCAAVPVEQRVAIIEHLRGALGPKVVRRGSL